MPVEQLPDVLAMVLADTVLRDVLSSKCYIQGTYSVILAHTGFPYHHPSIVVYLALTDGHGDTPLQLRLVDVDEAHEPILKRDFLVSFPNPLAVVEIVLAHPGALFPAEGEYRLQLYAAGQFLRERRLQVMARPAPDASPGTV